MKTTRDILVMVLDLQMQIERCGASPQLTAASIMAAEIYDAVRNLNLSQMASETLEAIEDHPSFREWAVVELMGRLKVVGLCTEATIAGQKLLRVDALNAKGESHTRYFGPGSIYAITPCSEQIARGMAANIGQDPISRFDITALARGPVQPGLPYAEDDDQGDGQ